MGELALKVGDHVEVIALPNHGLGEWLTRNVKPLNNRISLDTEASGLHPDGMWATDPNKCSPEARVSTMSMAWRDERTGQLMTVAIPFDQGRIGGKLGRYVTKVTKKTPVLGWETLPHTNECERAREAVQDSTYGLPCECAPWNFNDYAWHEVVKWLGNAYGPVERIDYFNAKYDMWIMLAGLRDGAHVPCGKCVGWKHHPACINAGVNLERKLGNDVMIFESIYDPAAKDSLDAVSRKYLGRGKEDDALTAALKANGPGMGKRYDLIPWSEMYRYAAVDAELTYLDSEVETKLVENDEVEVTDLKIIARDHRKLKTLFGMERRGVGFDVDLCLEQDEKMAKELDTLVDRLPFNDNPRAAAKYFYGSRAEGGLELMPFKLTDSGAPSCDAEVVARLAKEDGYAGEVAKEYAHVANMNSVRAKWYTAWPKRAGKDGRLRTNFWQCAVESDRKDKRSGGAISGRLSADRIQLQGVPQDWRIPSGIVGIKKLIRARPGHQLWSFDASNAEVRVTAWLTDCKALADVINSGVNIHSANTVNIFGKMLAATWPGGWPEDWPYDAFRRNDRPDMYTTNLAEAEIDKDDDPVYVLSEHPDWKKIRTSMKRGIFGTIYTSGIDTLKAQIDADLKDDIPRKDIEGFMRHLNEAYPEIKRTSRACMRKVDVAAGGQGFVRLVTGRRRVFGWGEKTYKALNACVQGGVAEAMSELMLVIDDEWPDMLVNQVHDDIWLEIPDELVAEVVPWVKAKGKEVFEGLFSTEDFPIAFKFDGKQLA